MTNFFDFSIRWYHGTISRDEAEAMLHSVPLHGSFLIRKRVEYGLDDIGSLYAISFRLVIHCSELRRY